MDSLSNPKISAYELVEKPVFGYLKISGSMIKWFIWLLYFRANDMLFIVFNYCFESCTAPPPAQLAKKITVELMPNDFTDNRLHTILIFAPSNRKLES